MQIKLATNSEILRHHSNQYAGPDISPLPQQLNIKYECGFRWDDPPPGPPVSISQLRWDHQHTLAALLHQHPSHHQSAIMHLQVFNAGNTILHDAMLRHNCNV